MSHDVYYLHALHSAHYMYVCNIGDKRNTKTNEQSYYEGYEPNVSILVLVIVALFLFSFVFDRIVKTRGF